MAFTLDPHAAAGCAPTLSTDTVDCRSPPASPPATPEPSQPAPLAAPAPAPNRPKLSPDGIPLNKDAAMWTVEEDMTILELVEQHGKRWSKIASHLPGRTDNGVRNRWNRMERAQNMRVRHGADHGYRCRRCGQPKRGHICAALTRGERPEGDELEKKAVALTALSATTLRNFIDVNDATGATAAATAAADAAPTFAFAPVGAATCAPPRPVPPALVKSDTTDTVDTVDLCDSPTLRAAPACSDARMDVNTSMNVFPATALPTALYYYPGAAGVAVQSAPALSAAPLAAQPGFVYGTLGLVAQGSFIASHPSHFATFPQTAVPIATASPPPSAAVPFRAPNHAPASPAPAAPAVAAVAVVAAPVAAPPQLEPEAAPLRAAPTGAPVDVDREAELGEIDLELLEAQVLALGDFLADDAALADALASPPPSPLHTAAAFDLGEFGDAAYEAALEPLSDAFGMSFFSHHGTAMEVC